MKTVFIFIGNRINVYDTIHSGFVAELAERHRVHVFFPTEMGGAALDTRSYPEIENVSFHTIPIPMGKWWTLFTELRSELLTRFDNLFYVQWTRKLGKHSSARRRLLRFLTHIFPVSWLTTEHFTQIELLSVPGYGEFKQYAQKHHPDLVLVSFSGNTPLEIYAILWARRAGIKTAMYNPTWDKFSCNTKQIRKTDRVITWNEQSKEQARALCGYAPDDVCVGGALRFDSYFRGEPMPMTRAEFLKSKGLDPSKKTIFFAGTCQGTFHKDFPRACIAWQKEGVFDGGVNLFIRAHTLDPLDEYDEFLNLPNVRVERAGVPKQSDRASGHKAEMNEADLANTKMTLAYSDVCVTINSTMSVEAMVFDMPVICAGFVPLYSELIYCESYKPVVDCGAARVAKTMDDIRGHIAAYLADSSLDRAGRKRAVTFAMGPTDGKTPGRIVHHIDTILEQ